MTQDKKKEILFFDHFVERKKEYIALSEKSYDKLFHELSKSITNQNKEIKISSTEVRKQRLLLRR